MKIKNILPVYITFFIICSSLNNVFSQDTTFIVMPKESALKKGNYALVFEAGTIFGSSGFFEAFTLTAKKHLTDKLAIRLSISGNMLEGNGDEKGYDNFGGVLRGADENHQYTFSSSINFQYFPDINSKIKPFTSIGPYAEYSYYGYFRPVYGDKQEEWGIGIFASCGLEMFIMDNISLIGEYIIKATYGKRLEKNWVSDNGFFEGYRYFTQYKVKLNTARLGFSVYF
jgi:hypothetical protein